MRCSTVFHCRLGCHSWLAAGASGCQLERLAWAPVPPRLPPSPLCQKNDTPCHAPTSPPATHLAGSAAGGEGTDDGALAALEHLDELEHPLGPRNQGLDPLRQRRWGQGKGRDSEGGEARRRRAHQLAVMASHQGRVVAWGWLAAASAARRPPPPPPRGPAPVALCCAVMCCAAHLADGEVLGEDGGGGEHVVQQHLQAVPPPVQGGTQGSALRWHTVDGDVGWVGAAS
jgi:hypothetical protein